MHAYLWASPTVSKGSNFQVSTHVMELTFIHTLYTLAVGSLLHKTADQQEY